MQDDLPDGVGRVPAVVQKLLIRGVALDKLVLLKGVDEIDKRLRRYLKATDRLLKGDRHRMPRRAVVAAEQFLSPPAEQIERPGPAAGFVAQVVGLTAEAVDGVEMRQQPPR